MDFSLLLTLALIHTVALISPGPDFAIMVKIATQQSRLTAMATALGISTAILLHTLFSLTGVSLLITRSQTLYLLIQMIGAGYLAWMGLGALRAGMGALCAKPRAWSGTAAKSALAQDGPKARSGAALNADLSVGRGFLAGFYTNLLNPKALVFFLTLFSALISPSVSFSTQLAATLGLFTLSLLWFGLLAAFLSRAQVQLRLQRLTLLIDTVIGLIFITVALAILLNLSLPAAWRTPG
ncbi:LysE family translocator [Shewanella sp.]|uniref:LysE family translocator n=1 Tax=Shewanella sp. TaxID=50422 RepID=UPI003F3EE68E